MHPHAFPWQNHRYPHGFSGDTFQHEVELYHQVSWVRACVSVWRPPYHCRDQVKTTQTAANVLWGYWSHDIGGFHKDYNASATGERIAPCNKCHDQPPPAPSL